MKIVTCIAPVNIAVIKYWGKRNEELILPVNDSISATLSVDHMCSKTTILASPTLKESKFWLNGKEESLDNPRLSNCLKEIRRKANQDLGELLGWNISICSVNNFPTAAGLASSAAGYACLVYALAKLYDVQDDISVIARRGSGSACRSVYGGWVRWYKGIQENGSDSVAKQLVPSTHWPEMRILILVVNDAQKKYSSTSGMKQSVKTSELLNYRADQVVPQRIDKITETINTKNFDKFARIVMQDSNQFHAICLDTFPPCFYLNDTSRTIIELVHWYNEFKESNKVAYTFDAGSNACLFLLDHDVEEFLAIVNYIFPPPNENLVEYFRGNSVQVKTLDEKIEKSIQIDQQPQSCLKYIISTEVGDGPKIINDPTGHLLNESGLPKHTVT